MARRTSVGHRVSHRSASAGDRAPRARRGRGPSQTIWISPKPCGLVEVDEALLEQLEDGEEAHDDLEPLDEVAGELAERDRARRRGSSSSSSIDGVGDRGPDGRDVVEVDPRDRLGRDGPEEGPAAGRRA